MVCDDAQCHIHLFILIISHICNPADMLHNILHGVYLEQVVYTLHDTCQTFQTHTGINILVFHFRVMAVAVAVKLAEYQVPDFNITVAVTAYMAIRLSASLFRTAVKVNLRTRAARTRAMLPEVVFSAQTNHVIFCNADLLRPHAIGFIVIFKDRDVQLICRHFQYLGKEFPCPGNGFNFKVIAEGEISQHFKISAVPCRLANALNIRRTDALLAGSHARIRRDSLSQKILFQRCHTGIDQQKALIPLRNQ